MPCALDPRCAHACCVACHPPRAAMTSSSHPKPQVSVFLSENFKVHTAVGLGRLAAHISHRMLRGDDVIRWTQKLNHMLSHTLPTCHSNRSPLPCRQVLLPAWPPLDFEIFQPSSARLWVVAHVLPTCRTHFPWPDRPPTLIAGRPCARARVIQVSAPSDIREWHSTPSWCVHQGVSGVSTGPPTPSRSTPP